MTAVLTAGVGTCRSFITTCSEGRIRLIPIPNYSALCVLRGPAVRQKSATGFNLQSVILRSRRISSARHNNDRDTSWKNTYALSFTVSPEQALQTFNRWAVDEQGLNYLISWRSIRIGAAYVPVWSFDLNLRFARTDRSKGSQKYAWKPELFAVYGDIAVVHVPGLSVYAGHTYRRSLVQPLHSTTLVFLGDNVVPFGNWMLRDMEMNEQRLPITPDPWNATRGRAFTILKEELQAIAETSLREEGGDSQFVAVQTQLVSSRRVYMPTYFIDYKVFGMEYRAFVSGCDVGATVSGVSHKVINTRLSTIDLGFATSTIFSGARIVSRDRNLLSVVIVLLQFVGGLVARLLARVPIIGLLGGAFVGFRKIIQPWMDNRWATAEWERQREHDAQQAQANYDDFFDSGVAEGYFRQHREKILRQLRGDDDHRTGDFDWYKQWEEWARQQWDYQQRQEYQQTYQQQNSRSYRQKPKQEYQWDFDPSDPYSVLGVNRSASLKEVSEAFRKQMLMYHPDVQPATASDAEKQRAIERSKLVSEAYRKIKSERKR